jgi:hypothetical protein
VGGSVAAGQMFRTVQQANYFDLKKSRRVER